MEKQKTILFAEDNREIREKTTLALKKQGYNVLEAEDGAVAAEFYDKNGFSIDVVLSDLDMPNMNGFDLAKHNYENNFLPFVVYASVEDAKPVLKLLEYGVHDYLEKPFIEEQLGNVINNAINRWSIHKNVEDDENLFSENLEAITFPSRCHELSHANNWIMNKISRIFNEHECDCFMNFLDEILFNAHEHGNLGISEEEKTHLIETGTFFQEVDRLEKLCDAVIKVSISILANQVSISVSDQGQGFDYEQYLSLTEEQVLNRIALPNGRGICMAQKYFDSIDYQDNGSTVLLTKRFA